LANLILQYLGKIGPRRDRIDVHKNLPVRDVAQEGLVNPARGATEAYFAGRNFLI
jgi:hypothetical protein